MASMAKAAASWKTPRRRGFGREGADGARAGGASAIEWLATTGAYLAFPAALAAFTKDAELITGRLAPLRGVASPTGIATMSCPLEMRPRFGAATGRLSVVPGVLALRASGVLRQQMAVLCAEPEPVDRAQLLDHLGRRLAERDLPLESVQHDPLDQLPQGDLQVLRQAFQHLQHAALDPEARLHPLDCYHITTVT